MAGIVGAGLWGIQTDAEIPVPPNTRGVVLATDLRSAVERFRAPESLAVTILGSEVVNAIAELKMHEVRDCLPKFALLTNT